MKKLIIVIAVFAAAGGAFAADTGAGTGAVVRGTITSVSGPVVTLMRNVKIDVSSAVITRGRQAMTADGLIVGARILAVISPSPSTRPGVLPAEAISVDPDEGTIIGPLTSLTSTAVTLDGQTIAVDSSTMYDGYYNQKPVLSAADIPAGVPVSVEVASVANGLIALEVRVLGPAPLAPPVPPLDEATITGTVTAIGDDVWTVGTTNVNITLKTTISNAPAPKVGDTVDVTGVKLPDGALIASAITRK
jgi:hypothetical protein